MEDEQLFTFRVFPVPEPLRLGPGEPTAPPGAPLTPYTVGEVAPEGGETRRRGHDAFTVPQRSE